MQHKVSGLSAVIAALFVVSGCAAVGEQYVEPAQWQQQATLNVDDTLSLNERQSQWWRSFDDPILTQLIDQALRNNTSLDIALANVEAAYAYFDDVDFDDFPIGDVQGQYSSSNQVVPGLSEQRVLSRSYRVGANLRWSLDLFGKLQHSSDAALADAEAQHFAYRSAQVNVISQVADTYGQLQGLNSQLNVSRKTLQSLATTQQIVTAREQAGYATQLDKLRIRAQVKSVEATIVQLEGDKKRLSYVLGSLLGLAPDEFVQQWQEQLAQSNAIPQVHKPLAIGAAQDILRYRFDVYEAERRLAANSARVGFNQAKLYPDISISGFLGFLSPDVDSLGSSTRAWSIAPTVSWPVFDYASINAQIGVAKANQQAALAGFRQTVNNALNEAQTAMDLYSNSVRQLHVIEQQVDASQRALVLAQVQYDAGSIALLDVLDVERTLLQANQQLSQVQSQVFSRLIEVYRSFGGGLDIQLPQQTTS